MKSELDEFKKLGGRDSKTDKITAKELDAQTKQLIAKLQNELKQKVRNLFLLKPVLNYKNSFF